MSCEAAAEHYDVSQSSAIRWVRRARETGSPAALPMGGKRQFALAEQREWLQARVAAKPDITLRALLAELGERGIAVSYYAVWHILDRAGLSFKKSLRASEQDRPDVARRREQWRRYRHKVDPRRLVFIDETWAKTNMTRTHGRCAVGQQTPGDKDRLASAQPCLRHQRVPGHHAH
jgi:transposase